MPVGRSENRLDGSNATKLRVLIVDDSAAHRRLMEKALDQSDYEVLSAANGQEALEICNIQSVGLVVSDWNMPGLSGIDLCRILKGTDG